MSSEVAALAALLRLIVDPLIGRLQRARTRACASVVVRVPVTPPVRATFASPAGPASTRVSAMSTPPRLLINTQNPHPATSRST
jgi:hypothetical protein